MYLPINNNKTSPLTKSCDCLEPTWFRMCAFRNNKILVLLSFIHRDIKSLKGSWMKITREVLEATTLYASALTTEIEQFYLDQVSLIFEFYQINLVRFFQSWNIFLMQILADFEDKFNTNSFFINNFSDKKYIVLSKFIWKNLVRIGIKIHL